MCYVNHAEIRGKQTLVMLNNCALKMKKYMRSKQLIGDTRDSLKPVPIDKDFFRNNNKVGPHDIHEKYFK